ncbi:MAG: CHAD domain-containing protein [Acidimicrobiaceae bacterium]|nr:CHAD domain-containing protein [Acidimicrobiaceae bacterium]
MASSRFSFLYTCKDAEAIVNTISQLPVPSHPGKIRHSNVKLLDTFDWALDASQTMLLVDESKSGTQVILSGSRYFMVAPVQPLESEWVLPGFLPNRFLRRHISELSADRALLVQSAISTTSYQICFFNSEGLAASILWLFHVPEFGRCAGLLVSKHGYRSFHQKVESALRDSFKGLKVRVEPGDIFDLVLNTQNRSRGDYRSKFSLDIEPLSYGCMALGQALASEQRRVKKNALWIKDHPDAEFLHDFRVALRRTSSFMKSLEPLMGPIDISWFRTELKLFINLTSPVRDLENLEGFVAKHAKSRPFNGDIALLCSRITADVSQSYADLSTSIPSERFEHLLSSWSNLARSCIALTLGDSISDGIPVLASDPRESVQPKTKVGDCARILLIDSGATLIKRAMKTKRNRTPESLHKLRKETKTFRYLLEFFEPVLEPDQARLCIGSIKKLQDALGNYQDAFVQVQLLENLCDKCQVPKENVIVLFQELEKSQQTAIANYVREIKLFSGPSLFHEIQLATGYRKK